MLSQVYIRGKGRVPYDPTQLSFCDEVKLTNADGSKISLCYEKEKTWSFGLPKFDTNNVSVKDKRYFLRTKFFRVVDAVNQLTGPIAQYIHANGEKFKVSKSEEEIKKMLMKDLFVARTLHTNVFIDITTGKPMDLSTLKSRFRTKVYVKPVVYIRNDDIYIDFEIVRATISTDLTNRQKVSSETNDENVNNNSEAVSNA
ncbi:hypothetical protein BH23THE1_BH23THE1_33140 [soil metagenome]